jgi:SlyX protein
MAEKNASGTHGDRITELETRVAFQDDTIARLNDVVVLQEQRIARLERELIALRTQVRAITPSQIADAGEEKPPPHY